MCICIIIPSWRGEEGKALLTQPASKEEKEEDLLSPNGINPYWKAVCFMFLLVVHTKLGAIPIDTSMLYCKYLYFFERLSF